MRRGGRLSGAGNARILFGFSVTKLQVLMRLYGRGVRVFLGDELEVRKICRGASLKGTVGTPSLCDFLC
jgi:hypothetical protein